VTGAEKGRLWGQVEKVHSIAAAQAWETVRVESPTAFMPSCRLCSGIGRSGHRFYKRSIKNGPTAYQVVKYRPRKEKIGGLRRNSGVCNVRHRTAGLKECN